MKKHIVCYPNPLGWNCFWEPLEEHQPSESTFIGRLNAATKEEIEDYRDTYAPKSRIIYR